ncbi:MAG: ATP-binding protein [Balneolales bacterium]|nr:ATP-binding protein [Balneolales bacterium]
MANNTLSFELSSTIKELDKLGNIVDQIIQRFPIKSSSDSILMLVISEAVTNAIVHGNKLNETKKVFLNCSLDNKTLTISIEDEGEGFNPDTVPDPLAEENLLKPSGRGLYLVREATTEVFHNEKGNKITFKFHIDVFNK